jgi:hypothetical protein
VWEKALPALKGTLKPGEYYNVKLAWNQTDFSGKPVPPGGYGVFLKPGLIHYAAASDGNDSFRFLPMMAFLVLNYASTVKNCRVTAVFYGGFEVLETSGDVSLINDLTVSGVIKELFLFFFVYNYNRKPRKCHISFFCGVNIYEDRAREEGVFFWSSRKYSWITIL